MWKNLKRNKAGLLGLTIIIVVLFCALAANIISPYDPLQQDIANKLKPPAWSEGGSGAHLLGTDQLGRDILSRVIHGSQISILISVAGTLVAIVTGLVLGSISGYYGGKWDSVIMRFVDINMAFPFVLLAIFIVAVMGPGVANIILVAGLSAGVSLARLIRGEILAVKELEYIEAIKSVGARDSAVIFKHIIPNIFNAIIVIATLEMAQLILVESSLSFLGLGVPAEIPTWGKMLSESRTLILSEPWVAIFPGLAITLTVLGINLFGDWLRDYFDPKLSGSSK
ncbi:ABC transporter permease [Paenibacillus hamazuiensis]|uniref:ABC transporter permease n=1 Tax=Paenibacillus hamazuiensis TaxID=2936508 RepID=UPI00200FF57F|nr:ABC transporter permease [Paenibacillus hamazuiensis]